MSLFYLEGMFACHCYRIDYLYVTEYLRLRRLYDRLSLFNKQSIVIIVIRIVPIYNSKVPNQILGCKCKGLLLKVNLNGRNLNKKRNYMLLHIVFSLFPKYRTGLSLRPHMILLNNIVMIYFTYLENCSLDRFINLLSICHYNVN